ncbi:uncharacterized protein At5g39570 [Rosa chinensis]|uniref:uncharacterized protein At5g39570 n=1 Tax=Rosa chinensis TaxID=74649 RepID=UPI000D095CE7|nr:uncharacterized protein At5g39570 [Rosa chinensis]
MTRYYTYYTNNQNGADDFNEYDPAPYEGGYDIGLIYGRPLPPSEEICYRRSSSPAKGNNYDSPEFKSSEPNAYDEKKLESEYSSYIRQSSHKENNENPDLKQNQQQPKPQEEQRQRSSESSREEEPTLAGEGGYGGRNKTNKRWWRSGSCCSSNGAIQ